MNARCWGGRAAWRKALWLGALALAACGPAAAFQLSDFTVHEGTITHVADIDEESGFDLGAGPRVRQPLMAGGGLLILGGPEPGVTLYRLTSAGAFEPILSVGDPADPSDTCYSDAAYFANPLDGTITLIYYCGDDTGWQMWRIDGLPRTLGACPAIPGDLSPGVVIEDVPGGADKWRVTGDGRVSIGDVVVALRASVQLIEIQWAP